MDSKEYSSKVVKRQIEDLGLLVKLTFIGPNFESTVEYLDKKSNAIKEGSKSYLLYHYKPSLVTHVYNLTDIKFDPCDLQWPNEINNINSSESTNCLYEYNRFAKVSIQCLAKKEIADALN